ncbi:hypothetical protein AX16_006788 [Volvariella volvacea WC 439]|nr:hypothetical protein AX16_006788 [Volvariella volvacea WC 439]
MSLTSALQTLATYRSNNIRASQDAFEKGTQLVESGSISKLGDERWAFLEQLALAAIDIGRLDVADNCLKQLADKFPESPRVDILTGIRMEATEPPERVLQYYKKLLEADSANAAAWKRKISVIRRIGRVDQAVEELSQFLDTFYTDVEGWLELADIYSSWNQYSSSLQALSHALLLAPQNPFIFLQFAETAYSAGDIPLALKMFLVVVDMAERDLSNPQKMPPTGINTRAWLGVKQCTRRLLRNSSAASSPSSTPVPKSLKKIDELATERVLAAYSSQAGAGVKDRNLVQSWLSNAS